MPPDAPEPTTMTGYTRGAAWMRTERYYAEQHARLITARWDTACHYAAVVHRPRGCRFDAAARQE